MLPLKSASDASLHVQDIAVLGTELAVENIKIESVIGLFDIFSYPKIFIRTQNYTLILDLHSSIYRISPIIMTSSNIVRWNTKHILGVKVLIINIFMHKKDKCWTRQSLSCTTVYCTRSDTGVARSNENVYSCTMYSPLIVPSNGDESITAETCPRK